MERLDIAVVVPSYNGASHLPNLLTAIKSQVSQPREVIVVLDGSTDQSLIELTKWRGQLPLKIIEQENRGRSGARNRGVMESESDILVFYDDDMIPSSDSLRRHWEFHNNREECILTGSAIEDPACRREICLWRNWLHDKWKGVSKIQRELSAHDLAITAANLSMSRTMFLMLGGFDEALSDCEDYDLAVKAYSEDVSIFFDPENKSVHQGFRSIRFYARRQRQYRKAQMELFKSRSNHKHSGLYAKYVPKPKRILKFLYFFVPGILLQIFDLGYFKLLPQSLRFGVYSRVFSALTVYYPNRKL